MGELILTTMKELPKKRIYESLDMWRGLLAIWVVIFHITLIPGVYKQSIIPSNFFELFIGLGPLRVPMFFVISGYCMAAATASVLDRGHSAGKFLAARIRRIFPPHLAVLLGSILLGGLLWVAQTSRLIGGSASAENFAKLSYQEVIANALLMQIPLKQISLNPVTWTLCYEVAFYCVMTVAILVFQKQGWQFLLKVLHVVTVVTLGISLFYPAVLIFPFNAIANVQVGSEDIMLNAWTSFGEGLLLFDLLCGLTWKDRSTKARYFYSGVISLLIIMIGLQAINSKMIYAQNLVGTTCFAILLYFLYPLDKKMKNIKWLKSLFFVGGMSYSLYLTHDLVLLMWHYQLERMHLKFPLFLPYLAVSLAISLGVAYVFYILIESRFISSKAKKSAVPSVNSVNDRSIKTDIGHLDNRMFSETATK